MKHRVWTEITLHPDVLPRLQAEAEVIRGTWDNLEGVDAAIIGGSRVDGDFFDRTGSNLKLVIRHGIGYNTVDVAAASARGVLAANTPDGPTESTAEHAVALLLAVAKRVVKSDRYLRTRTTGRSDRPYLLGTEVYEQVLGVIGYGRIGRRVAEICALGLKMWVVVYDPFLPEGISLLERVSRVDDLDTLLSQADFVTLHTPLTPETYHLLGARELQQMKPGSYLINASRGLVVDEAALIQALQSGHLAGAGLDVSDPEPPKHDNPLLQMEDVVLTPHVASNTSQGLFRMGSSVVDQVLQVLRGERPSHLINPEAWPGRVSRLTVDD